VKRPSTARKPGNRAAIDEGRDLLRQQKWSAALSMLSAADRDEPLEPDDLEALGAAAHLIGLDTESAGFLARAHQGFLARGDVQHAARCALWLGFHLMVSGEQAKSGGWISRAARLLEGQPDCVEKGYLRLPAGYSAVHRGDAATAYGAFAEAVAIGERFRDRDLVTLALQGQGRALIRQGEITHGVSLLDEAMVAVTAGEVSSIVAGSVYCSVIEACSEIYDLGRAHEWTSALEQWCHSLPDAIAYRGHCLVRRAEILQLHGAWSDALGQAERARELLSQPTPRPAVGAAIYCMGELHRLRGEFAKAEEAYRQASQWDRTPHPGLALLRLAQGELTAASSAIRRVSEQMTEGPSRATVLDAYIQIMLFVPDVTAARTAADELEDFALKQGAPFLRALSCRAKGSVLLAEGNARDALAALRQSWTTWCELDAPYEAARTRVLIASACSEMGDDDAAQIELAAAREVFKKLGAVTDLDATGSSSSNTARVSRGALTAREVEVIRLVAEGMTNKGIAKKLGVSEKTIARHLSNIFTKLDLPSRAAATAYAYQHKLV
jgi:ATP/maltotriose-dependent transcriptional regulator MalT